MRARNARSILRVTARAGLLVGLLVGLAIPSARAGSLRFYGHGGEPGDAFVFRDRVKIASAPPAAINVGSGDFTVELFLRARAADNPNGPAYCGAGIAWVNGNILIDRDRFNQGRSWGISLLAGRVAFGVSNDANSFTVCGGTEILDDAWHHVAVDRRASDGRLRIWVDGVLDGQAAGGSGMPSGDVSYPENATPGAHCSPDGGAGSAPCTASDPYLVFGAEKHGFSGINYRGALDEIRVSSTLRYSGNFTAPTAPFASDPTTAALYHLDDASGDVVADASGRGGQGTRFFGGSPPPGPVWQADSPFAVRVPSAASNAGGAIGLAIALLLLGAGRLKRTDNRHRDRSDFVGL